MSDDRDTTSDQNERIRITEQDARMLVSANVSAYNSMKFTARSVVAITIAILAIILSNFNSKLLISSDTEFITRVSSYCSISSGDSDALALTGILIVIFSSVVIGYLLSMSADAFSKIVLTSKPSNVIYGDPSDAELVIVNYRTNYQYAEWVKNSRKELLKVERMFKNFIVQYIYIVLCIYSIVSLINFARTRSQYLLLFGFGVATLLGVLVLIRSTLDLRQYVSRSGKPTTIFPSENNIDGFSIIVIQGIASLSGVLGITTLLHTFL